MDTCNATRRERAKLLICELALHHTGHHRDNEIFWPGDSASTPVNIIEIGPAGITVPLQQPVIVPRTER